MTLFMTWAQGRVEMSSVAPTAHKAISTGKEATSFWTLTRSQNLDPQPRAAWQAGRQGDCSAGNSPKGLGCGFPE